MRYLGFAAAAALAAMLALPATSFALPGHPVARTTNAATKTVVGSAKYAGRTVYRGGRVVVRTVDRGFTCLVSFGHRC